GDAALYFNPLDAEQLAHHLNTIAVNQNVREDLVAKGYKRIKEFSWDRAAQETYGIFARFS
ncbi:MAG: glycosyltransferase family 1 protein, partial [Saprospiraceae bacterium]